MSDSIDCPICYLPQSQWHGSTKAKCGHDVCMPCLLTWASSNPTCPMCRNSLTNAIVPVEDDDNMDFGWGFMMPADEAPLVAAPLSSGERRRLHAERRHESSVRRQAFLVDKKFEFETHIATCTDAICISTHSRRRNWLNKGRLVPLPKQINSLIPQELNFLIRGSRMGVQTRGRLGAEILILGGNYPECRRLNGFLRAVSQQRTAAEDRRAERKIDKGCVVNRLGTTLQTALLTDKSSETAPALRSGVKVFEGCCPPKRGARVGDVYRRGARYARCVGHHLWSYMDGSTMRWDSKLRHWWWKGTAAGSWQKMDNPIEV